MLQFCPILARKAFPPHSAASCSARVAAMDGVPVLLGGSDVHRCHLRPPCPPVFPLMSSLAYMLTLWIDKVL